MHAEEGVFCQEQQSSTSNNAIFMEIVGGRNKKGHIYRLGQLGDEFLVSSSIEFDTSSVDVQRLRQLGRIS